RLTYPKGLGDLAFGRKIVARLHAPLDNRSAQPLDNDITKARGNGGGGVVGPCGRIELRFHSFLRANPCLRFYTSPRGATRDFMHCKLSAYQIGRIEFMIWNLITMSHPFDDTVAEIIVHPLKAALPTIQTTSQGDYPAVQILVVEIRTKGGLTGF